MGKIILAGLAVFTLLACTPVMTYEELEADATLTGDSTRLDKFEATVKQADAYYENKYLCKRSRDHVWFCSASTMASRRMERNESKNIDEYVRKYRHERQACGCMSREALRGIMR